MGMRPIMATLTGCSVGVLPDAESLSVAAAAVVMAEARRAMKRTGRFTIALSGGGTPKPVYQLLAAPPFADLVPWHATHVFWGDERCVEPADARSNEHMARLALLEHVPIPPGQVHPIRCPGPRGDGALSDGAKRAESGARAAADGYERLLRGFFRAGASDAGVPPASAGAAAGGLDLVLLGIGDNGHTASLFRGSHVLSEQERWAAASYEDPATAAATSGNGERLWRVTLTAPFINRADLVLFVASGRSKAAVVREAILGDADPRVLPARLIRPSSGRLWWLLDEEAASLLQLTPISAAPRRAVCGAGGRGAGKSGPAQDGAALKDAAQPESFDDLPDCELGPSR